MRLPPNLSRTRCPRNSTLGEDLVAPQNGHLRGQAGAAPSQAGPGDRWTKPGVRAGAGQAWPPGSRSPQPGRAVLKVQR